MSNACTIVLVPGAFHGAWCWERVTPLLEQRGMAVRTLDLPSTNAYAPSGATLSADAAAVSEIVAGLSGPVVLCGHSYGGMVISLAAASHSNVMHLVYVSGIMPAEGESLLDIGGGQTPPWVRMLEGGLAQPDLTLAVEAFYGDCDPDTQKWAIRRVRPTSAVAFAEPVPTPAWRKIPSTYVACLQDKAVPLEMQRALFAPRANRVLELNSSHSPFLSQPALLAEALLTCMSV